MQSITILDFDYWRTVARSAIAQEIAPAEIDLAEATDQTNLFERDPAELGFDKNAKPAFKVDRQFIPLAETVGFQRDPDRWNRLYRVLWRLTHGEPHLLEIATDEDVLRLNRMEKEVRRDAHKMKAFVRFRKIVRDGEEYFIAWHRPDHRIVRKVAPFFSRRFKAMNWTILTPDESVTWDQQELRYGDGVPRSAAPDFDELESLWKTYYANIFNPARVKINMMKSEMPVRHWATLPEAEIIADLLVQAPRRVEAMIEQHEGFAETARDLIENHSTDVTSLSQLGQLAANCAACDLHHDATQTVFGQGPRDARIVLVGEQPGDQEDLAGQPFVGPAGKVLDQALAAAGLDRDALYITNIVKHFKHKPTQTPRGKKRLHQRPDAREIRCCRPWFDAEWAMLAEAEVLVCLGATAAKAIIGPDFRLSSKRGQFVVSDYCRQTIATWHPSAVLRAPNDALRSLKTQQLIADLRMASRVLHGGNERL